MNPCENCGDLGPDDFCIKRPVCGKYEAYVHDVVAVLPDHTQAMCGEG